MRQQKFYSFLNDFVFKYAFGREKNEKLLIFLLNALLEYPKDQEIEQLSILNPFNLKESADAKLSVLDVKVKDVQGKLFNIEVQVQEFPDYVSRSLYYLSKLFSGQLDEGDLYTDLRKTTGLSILGFSLFKSEVDLHNTYRLCNLKSHRELTDVLEMHYVELPKFQGNKPSHLRSRFEKWLHVLKFGEFYADEKKPLPQALKTEEGIEMAIQALRQVNADREMRQLMEVREKERLDRNSLLRDAEVRGEARGEIRGEARGEIRGEARGEARGMALGEAKALEDMVRKMRKKGKSPEEICEILDLDFSFVKKILKK